MTDQDVRRDLLVTPRWRWAALIVCGAALGVINFCADELSGFLATALTALTATGFAWSFVALITGYVAAARKRGVTAAIALLLVATATYYLLVLLVSQRWRGAYTEDGRSADMDGLLSVARATIFWIVGSVGAGWVFGYLGSTMRRGSRRSTSLSAGIAFGLLAGQGVYFAIVMSQWRLGPDYGGVVFLSSVLGIALSAVAICVIVIAQRSRISGWLLGASALVSTVLGSALWGLVEAVRGTGF